MQEQDKIIKAIAQEIVQRIKDDSVSVIWNDSIENLVHESITNAFGGEAIDDKIFNHYKDEVIFEALEAVEYEDKFDNNLSMVLQTAKKNFTEEIPGVLFLVQNNAWAVVNFGEELVPFLKGEALQELHQVAEYIEDPTFLEPYHALINKYPELVPEEFKKNFE